MKYIKIETTFEKRNEAARVASLLIDNKLASCCQLSEIVSYYNFENKRCEENEVLLTLKTKAELYEKCEQFIKENHSYKVPQIIATKIKYGSCDYLNWINESVRGEE